MKIKNYSKKQPRIEMLPLIDIVFLLLIFFIYTMLSMSVHHGLDLNLPTSAQVENSEDTPISLSISSEESGLLLFINETPVTLSELADQLRIANNTNTARDQILIFGSQDLSYQQLFLVLDQVKESGIGKISLQATPE